MLLCQRKVYTCITNKKIQQLKSADMQQATYIIRTFATPYWILWGRETRQEAKVRAKKSSENIFGYFQQKKVWKKASLTKDNGFGSLVSSNAFLDDCSTFNANFVS